MIKLIFKVNIKFYVKIIKWTSPPRSHLLFLWVIEIELGNS